MENSIEKEEEILNNIKAYMQENIDKGYHKFVYNDLGYDEKCVDVINAIEHILSDYKRVLKENEIYKKNSEIMSKENLSTSEQLKVEIKENFRLKNQLENNRKEYRGTYKDVREELKELKKENEELRKELNEENKRCMMLAAEKQDYFEKYKYHLQQNESLTRESSNYIPVQKVKDKIEELKKQDKEWTEELSEPDSNFKNIDRNLKRIKNQTEVLKGLLESEKN